MRQSIAIIVLFAALCATAAGAARAGAPADEAWRSASGAGDTGAHGADALSCAYGPRAELDIYFPRDEGALTAQAHAALAAFAERIEGCQVTTLNATVLADDAGHPDRRDALFDARRIAVLRALTAEGVNPARVTVDLVVRRSDGAAPDTAPDAALPMGRRVELEFDLDAPTVG